MRMRCYSVAIASAILSSNLAQAQLFTFDTSTASDWSVTAGGAVDVQPYVVTPYNDAYTTSAICVTSTGNSDGTFLPGGSLVNFDGYWTATCNFSLPANAVNVVLTYSKFFADDRAVLMLNGDIINATGTTTGTGYMVLTDGNPATPYDFGSTAVGQASGTVTTGFNVGGINSIEVIINNTQSGVAGTMEGNLYTFDGTGMGITGSISYSVIPEPSAGALILLAGLGFVLTARKKLKTLS